MAHAHIGKSLLVTLLFAALALAPLTGASDGGDAEGPEVRMHPSFAGDLNGDGAADVIVTERVAQGDGVHALRAVDGVTGALLWSRDYALARDVYLQLAGDVTGDGVPDVLVVAFERAQTGVCEPVACAAFAVVSEYAWTLTVLHGATGTPAWSTTIGGTPVEAGVTSFPLFGLHVARVHGNVADRASEGVHLVGRAGDLTGDGAAEIVLNVADSRFVHGSVHAQSPGGDASAGTAQTRHATHARVYSGATGDVVYTRSTNETENAFGLLLPAGNAVGDATPDLVWQVTHPAPAPVACAEFAGGAACAGEDRESVTRVELVDGAVLTPAWNRTLYGQPGTDVLAIPLLNDADGDAAADVFAFTVESPPLTGTPVTATTAFSGADGALLWTRADAVDPRGVGPVGGGPGRDFHAVTVDAEAVSVTRVDGATGASLFTTRHALPGVPDGETSSAPTVSARIFGDGDGDGVLDVVVRVEQDACSGHPRTPDRGACEQNVIVLVESIGTGAVLHRVDDPAFQWSAGAGDVDADGRDDVVTHASSITRDPAPASAFTVSTFSPTSAHAWSREFFFAGRAAGAPLVGGDVNADGAHDVLYALFYEDADGRSRSTVLALDGPSGVTLWAVGDALPDA